MRTVKKFGNKILLIFVIMNSCILAWLTISGADMLKQIKIKTGSIKSTRFDSRSASADLSSVKEFSETLPADLKDITFHFKMKVNSIGEYNNVFQTAPVNEGIRLELTAPATAALIVGASNGAKYTVIIFSKTLELNTWHQVDIAIDRKNHVKVDLDQKTAIDSLFPDLNYTLNDIAVGAGLSKTRPFDGMIDDFSITYSLFNRYPNADFIIFVVKDILFIATIILLFFLLIPRKREPINAIE